MLRLYARSGISNLIRGTASFSSTSVRCSDDINKAIKQKEPRQIDADDFIHPEKQRHVGEYITIERAANVAPLSGIPLDHLRERRVRIYEPSKNCMQSGTSNIGFWQLDFDTRERWENPLMGWTSSGDPLSNLKLDFNSKDDAIAYCEKFGWKWYVMESKTEKQEKVKSYGANFAWNKRTRVSTK